MAHQQTTTTIQLEVSGRSVLYSLMHKSPATRKYYQVNLFVPDNGIPIIEYHQASTKKPKKSILFVDLLFADKRHDTNDKFAFSVYTIDKTITFIAQDETTMNEWLAKIREIHSNLYPEFKRYDAVFEGELSDKGLAKTMDIKGKYRLALSKDSLDLIPLLTDPLLSSTKQHFFPILNNNSSSISTNNATATTSSSSSTASSSKLGNTTITNSTSEIGYHHSHHHNHHHHHHHHHNSIIHPLSKNANIAPHTNHNNLHILLPNHQRFNKRHPMLSSKTIELVLKSIRRCGHTNRNFFIELGRHSQIGEGHLWVALNKKSTARHLHELLLATMKLATVNEDQFLYKTPRSRSGSSSENHRSQQSRSSSLICLANGDGSSILNCNGSSPTSIDNYLSNQSAVVSASLTSPQQSNTIISKLATITSPIISTIPMLSSSNNTTATTSNSVDDDSGYLPMA